MELVRSLNLGARFLLEIAAVGALGFWGFQFDKESALRWVVGIGAPLLVIVVWSMFIAPKADSGLSDASKMWLGTVVLGGTAVALAAARRPALAGVFGAAIVVNALLMQLWEH